MAELEPHRVQGMGFLGPLCAIESIAQERMPHECRMYANLMGASGIKMESNHAFRCILPQHAVACTSRLALGRDTALDKGAILAGYGLSDDPGEFFPRAMREGKVELFMGALVSI